MRRASADFGWWYLGQRTDIEQHECISAQLKFKPDDSEEA